MAVSGDLRKRLQELREARAACEKSGALTTGAKLRPRPRSCAPPQDRDASGDDDDPPPRRSASLTPRPCPGTTRDVASGTRDDANDGGACDAEEGELALLRQQVRRGCYFPGEAGAPAAAAGSPDRGAPACSWVA